MLFWLVCAALTLSVAAIVVTPMLRAKPQATENPDMAIYRAQLAEIDRDLEREVIIGPEAENARTEIARRLLAASKDAATPQAGPFRPARAASGVAAAVMAVLSFFLYQQLGAPGYGDLPLQARLAASDEMRANRPSQAALEQAAPGLPPVEAPQDYLDAIAQLRAIAPTRPDDLQAWELLTFHESELRNYSAAAQAAQRVVAIKGEDATLDDRRQMLDLTVAAAGGLVSPVAERMARDMLEIDARDVPARFYLGALYNQTDRPDLAYRIWRDIVETGDPATFHVAMARDRIEDAAFRAGVEYTLPAVRGPSADDIAAAQDMSPEDRQAMIGNMVAGLADRLANEGGTAADWARLITAYGVLGDTLSARTVWVEAADVFGADPAAMEVLTDAATRAGVAE